MPAHTRLSHALHFFFLFFLFLARPARATSLTFDRCVRTTVCDGNRLCVPLDAGVPNGTAVSDKRYCALNTCVCLPPALLSCTSSAECVAGEHCVGDGLTPFFCASRFAAPSVLSLPAIEQYLSPSRSPPSCTEEADLTVEGEGEGEGDLIIIPPGEKCSDKEAGFCERYNSEWRCLQTRPILLKETGNRSAHCCAYDGELCSCFPRLATACSRHSCTTGQAAVTCIPNVRAPSMCFADTSATMVTPYATPTITATTPPTSTGTTTATPSVSQFPTATTSLFEFAPPPSSSFESPTRPPTLSEAPHPFQVSPPGAQEQEGDDIGVCVAVASLPLRTRVVFARHRRAAVLCDEQGSCATPGHFVVVDSSLVLTMREYCARLQQPCRARVMWVNSPRYNGRGTGVRSVKTPGLVYTAHAARYGAPFEVALIRLLIRAGVV